MPLPFAVPAVPISGCTEGDSQPYREAPSGEVRQPGGFGWLAEPAQETGQPYRPASGAARQHPNDPRMKEIRVRTTQRCELVEITDRLQALLDESGLTEGALVAQSMHTPPALTFNENADPDVRHDLLAKLERLAPQREAFYLHAEGNSDSHLKTSFFGPSLTVLVSGGRLVLGTWQGVYFCEFDGPRERRVAVQLLPAVGA